jgi:DNA polymerase-3 subunit gamma/tau
VADPCGECDSCRELARGGPGSIDVIEIDAASHNGVDDARDLREKAFFAPVRDRYKVYIIDEAHMVTPQAFNALLKLVEEPPPHLRFIFATTEPDKVLATIRSRTHHYPFRLIPPRLLSSYLSELCVKEDVAIEPAALPLVVRAGAGSARDTLSVLDQLLGGAGPAGVTHALATGLLGFTPDSLLDEVVDALAAGDGASVFGVVDKVIETGQDPRRFTEDLLRRLRDLVIVAAVPDAPATGLIDCSEDQGERLVAQAARFGRSDLSRAADLVASGLTEMRGATAPRLLLELICARVLLPGADHTTDGLLARLDRIERRASIAGGASGGAGSVPALPPSTQSPSFVGGRPAPSTAGETAGTEPTPPETPPNVAETPPDSGASLAPGPVPPETEVVPPPPSGNTLSLVDVRRLWPDIVEATKSRRRLTWIHLTQHAQVLAVDATTLTLGFSNAGARDSFAKGGSTEIVRQAAIDVVGADWAVEAIVDPSAQPDPTEPRVIREATAPPPSSPPQEAPEPPNADEPAAQEPAAQEPVPESNSSTAAREAIQQTRPAGADPQAPSPERALADAEADRDDPVIEDAGLGTAELLQRTLGAEVIAEIPHS